MFGRFIAFLVLIGIGFFLGLAQAEPLFHSFPGLKANVSALALSHTENSSVPTLVRCANEVDTKDWQVYRTEQLGYQFLYPSNATVEKKGDVITIKEVPTDSLSADIITLERLSGSYERYINESMQQGSWKIANRKTYALTTPFYSDEETGAFTSRYLFIKNFPQHGINGNYIMVKATVVLGQQSKKQFENARKQGIVDVESILTMPEQILSTFRFIEFDEGKDQG